MTLAEALDIVVGKTGHRRFRDLTDPTHPEYHPGTVAVVMRMARAEPLSGAPEVVGHGATIVGPQPAKVPIPAVLEFHRRMRACPHWERSSGCGCGLNRCKVGKGKEGVVSHDDCRSCLGLL